MSIISFIIGEWQALDKCIFTIFHTMAICSATVLFELNAPIEHELIYKLVELTRHGNVFFDYTDIT